MRKDEIVDEIHRGREEYAARFNYDIAAMVHDIQQRQEQERRNGRVYVTLSSQWPDDILAKALLPRDDEPEEQPKAS